MVNPIAQALMQAPEPFIWGRGGARMTPEQIAREREIAEALGVVDTSPVGHWTQGAARMANALVGRIKEGRAASAEAQNASDSQSAIANALASAGMGGAFPPAPVSGGSASVSAPSIPQTAEASAIREGLVSRGLPPHVADAFVLNFQDESGLNPGINERNPIVPGSRGGFGLYQLTGPRRTAYEQFAGQRGVDPSDVDAQLDWLMHELQGPEAKAAQSILSAGDTGTAAAAIVNDFLRPAPEHRTSRASRYMALAGQGGQAPASQALDALAGGPPVQVASLDPSVGMEQAAPAPEPSMQVAQALAGPDLSQIPVTAGGNAGVVQPGQSQGINPAIIQALSSPYVNDQTRQIAQMLLGQQMQQNDPMRALEMDYKRAQIEKMGRESAGGDTRFGLNPIYGQDAEGNTVLGVLGNDGSFKAVDTGGVNISTGVDRVDLGTQWGLLDKRTGQMVGTLPKENYQEAFDTASGSNDAKSAAEARTNLPKVEDNATAILGMIESLSTDPYLDSMVGPVSGRLPNVSGDAARVQSKMDQIGGQAFLQAFETLRGGGQISNVEGERATAALARLNTAQSPQDYRQALSELSAIVRTSLERARRSAGSGDGSTPSSSSSEGWQDMGGVKIRRKP